MTGKRAE